MRIVDNFEPHVSKPLDTRFWVNNTSELNTLGYSDQAYPYMRVLNLDDGEIYQLNKTKTAWERLNTKAKSVTKTVTTDANGIVANVCNGYVIYATSIASTYTERTIGSKTITIPDVSVQEVTKSIEIGGTTYTFKVKEPVVTSHTEDVATVTTTSKTVDYVPIPFVKNNQNCLLFQYRDQVLASKSFSVTIYYI